MNRLIAVILTILVTLAAPTTARAADPPFWVIKGSHSTVYLLGSVHVLRPDAPWRTPKIDAAVKASDALWLEIPDADDAAALQPLVMKLGVDSAHPLSTKLTKEQVARLDEIAKKAGIPGGETPLEPLRPWMAALTLGLMPLSKAGFDPKSGVEFTLKPEFVKANKPVHGFETATQQLHFFSDLSQKQEVAYLASTLENFDDAAPQLNKLIDAWYAGDTAKINDLMNGQFRDKYPELYQSLVVQRNNSWVPQFLKLLNGTGTSFVAVGAAHLVGPDGVPSLLEKAGYKVERQ